LTFNGGDRSIEDTHKIRGDEGLREILTLEKLPSSDATGDWFRRIGTGGDLKGLEKVNKHFLKLSYQV